MDRRFFLKALAGSSCTGTISTLFDGNALGKESPSRQNEKPGKDKGTNKKDKALYEAKSGGRNKIVTFK